MSVVGIFLGIILAALAIFCLYRAIKVKKKRQGRTIGVKVGISVVILVILVVIALSTVSCYDKEKAQAARSELVNVQTAMDIMMAKNQMTTVTPVTEATNNMATFPPNSPLYPDYWSTATTDGAYTCDINGLITQEDFDY